MNRGVAASCAAGEIVGNGSFTHGLKQWIARVARTDTNVLITGETGTGKELVASLLHRGSRRAAGPYVCINCAAIPDDLLESELFGHERGAFTGAYAAKQGKLKAADGGTVFLDEVGDLSLCSQAKILRALEDRRVERLGGSAAVSLDVRVICATNQCLEALVAEGKFRQDLYYRLNVARIHLPPLRERRADVPLLLDHFLRAFQHLAPGGHLVLHHEVREALARYDWPGNIREVRNFVEALCATAPSSFVTLAELPEHFRAQLNNIHSVNGSDNHQRNTLLAVLSSYNWNKTRTAEALRCSRMTLYRRLARHGIRLAAAVSLAAVPVHFTVRSHHHAFHPHRGSWVERISRDLSKPNVTIL